MAFTDVEMAILSQLSYCGATGEVSKSKNPSTAPQEDQPLYQLLVENEQWLRSKLGNGYSNAIDGLKTKVQNADYEIVLVEDDKHGTGFSAIAIKDPSNNVTVAARGTEGFSMDYDSRKDVAADVELAYLLSTSQQERMEVFMRNLEDNDYDGYYFTGHSLGGNLANYGAITLKPIKKAKGVVTFNAPGFNEAFIYKYATEVDGIYNKVKNYQNEYDYVSSIMFVPGQVGIIESSKKEGGLFDFDDHIGFDDHSLNNLAVNGNGFNPKEPQIKSIQTEVGHVLVEYVRNVTGIKGYTMFLGVVEICVNVGRLAITGLQKLLTWITQRFTSKNTDYYGPYIRANTASLRGYADRLVRVNQRISTLDRRMDSLYTKVGLRDLWNLLQADLMTGYSGRISNCAKYLYETADDLDTVERKITTNF